MLGDLARETYALTLKTLNYPLVARLKIDLRGIPVIFGETDNMQVNPHLRATLPLYRIKYIPSYKPKYKDKPMLLETDLYLERKVVRFDTYADLVEMAKEDEAIAFILKWTNISEELIEFAKQYVQIPIPFIFDVLKYEAEMRRQLGDPEASVFKADWMIEMELDRIEEVQKEKHKQNIGLHAKMKKEARDNAKY